MNDIDKERLLQERLAKKLWLCFSCRRHMRAASRVLRLRTQATPVSVQHTDLRVVLS